MKKYTIKKCIVIPFGLRLDWIADYEMETARTLAKDNIVIVFAYGDGGSIRKYILKPFPILTKISDSLYIYRPVYILPCQRLTIVRDINARIASWHLRFFIHIHKTWRILPRVYWSFSLQSVIQPRYFGNSFFSIYDCVDIFTSAHRHTAKILKQFEHNVMRQSHAILTNSSSLYTLQKNRHNLVIQTGEGLFALDKFSSFPKKPIPKDIKNIPRPRALFAGNISARLNFHLIYELAKQTPSVSYVFIGRNDPSFIGVKSTQLNHELEHLTTLPNVYMLGEKPKRSMVGYMAASDIGFVPYETGHIFNRYSSPMKIQEYFYMGIPVLSTPLPEIQRLYPYARVFSTPKEGANAIQKLLRKPWPSGYKRVQKTIAESNSIEQKIMFVTNILHTHYPKYF